jgi:hypothetical protein
MVALRLVSPRITDNPTKPIDLEAGLEMLARAEADRTEAWETVLLLADQATAHAALRWHNAVRREANFASNRPNDAKSDDWVAIVRSVDKARDLFYEAARNSINVGGGSVAVAQLLPAADRTQPNRGRDNGKPADL